MLKGMLAFLDTSFIHKLGSHYFSALFLKDFVSSSATYIDKLMICFLCDYQLTKYGCLRASNHFEVFCM